MKISSGDISTRPPAGWAASASTRSPRRRCITTTAPLRLATPGAPGLLDGGQYQWRRDGEYHLFNPETVFRLQHATAVGPVRDLQEIHHA